VAGSLVPYNVAKILFLNVAPAEDSIQGEGAQELLLLFAHSESDFNLIGWAGSG
jgi:hypothetical protein